MTDNWDLFLSLLFPTTCPFESHALPMDRFLFDAQTATESCAAHLTSFPSTSAARLVHQLLVTSASNGPQISPRALYAKVSHLRLYFHRACRCPSLCALIVSLFSFFICPRISSFFFLNTTTVQSKRSRRSFRVRRQYGGPLVNA